VNWNWPEEISVIVPSTVQFASGNERLLVARMVRLGRLELPVAKDNLVAEVQRCGGKLKFKGASVHMLPGFTRQCALVGGQVKGRFNHPIIARVNGRTAGEQRQRQSRAAVVLQRTKLRIQRVGTGAGKIAIEPVSKTAAAVGLAE
jgi:hypothetical protein